MSIHVLKGEHDLLLPNLGMDRLGMDRLGTDLLGMDPLAMEWGQWGQWGLGMDLKMDPLGMDLLVMGPLEWDLLVMGPLALGKGMDLLAMGPLEWGVPCKFHVLQVHPTSIKRSSRPYAVSRSTLGFRF
jgi:hypothetical protein